MKETEFKKVIAQLSGLAEKELVFDYPPQIEQGDLCLACFSLAKKNNCSPVEAAQKLATVCKNNKDLSNITISITAVGPYVNFKFIATELFAKATLRANPKNWNKLLAKKKTMVEFLSPNANKPLHLGHLRNAVIGDALSNILSVAGQKVIKANLINDRGVHICKSMLAWQKWAGSATPESANKKGDHFVGDWYVKFSQEAKSNPELENEAQAMLLKWEQGDKEIIALWETMTKWVLVGFSVTLKKLGIDFDKVYFESKTYKLGKDIIELGIKKGIFEKRNDNSVVYHLPENEFGKDKDAAEKILTLIRSDGTSVYITQDLGTAVHKAKEFNLDRSIIVTASEQIYHFKCLFHILKKLGYKWADECYHLSYGMVNLPDGKMKSREGNVVDTDDLIEEMITRAIAVISQKHPELEALEAASRAEIIGLGAMKYYMLALGPKNDLKYDPEASIALEGVTGPYCQYAAVRAKKILAKAHKLGIKIPAKANNKIDVNNDERELLKKIIQLPESILSSAMELNPSTLARQIYEIASSFNQFYNSNPVVKTEQDARNNPIDKNQTQNRLLLVSLALNAITNGLKLLGIKTPEEM